MALMVDEQEYAWIILYEHGYLKNTKNPSQNAFFTPAAARRLTQSARTFWGGTYVHTHTHNILRTRVGTHVK